MKKFYTITQKAICTLLCILMLLPSIPARAASYATISEGLYTIESALASKLVLDVSGNGTANCTNIQVYTSNSTPAQEFKIEKVSGDWHRIIHKYSGKVFDVAGGSKSSGTNVQLYQWNGTDAQLWRFTSAGNGYYYIQNKLGNYLDVYSGGKSSGTNVWVYTGNQTAAQRWVLRSVGATQPKVTTTPSQSTTASATTTSTTQSSATNTTPSTSTHTSIPSGNYNIVSALGSNLVLDVSGNGTANCTNIQVYTSNTDSTAQVFQPIAVSNGWYKILHTHSGRVLDVSGGSKVSGTNVQLYQWNGTDAQLWRFVPNGDGGCYIQSKLGNYLDVSSGGKTSGTNVWVYSGNQTPAQTWYLRPICTAPSVSYLKVTKSDSAVIRSGSGEKYSIVARIPTGTILESTGSCYNSAGNKWYKVQYEGTTRYIYSGNVSQVEHQFESFSFDNVTYRVCDCGKVTVSAPTQTKANQGERIANYSYAYAGAAVALPASSGLSMAGYGAAAGAAAASDFVLPIGDIVGLLILAYGAYEVATSTSITKQTASEIATELDFSEYLKDNPTVCSEATFRMVNRHTGANLTYVGTACYNAAQAYVLARFGADVYTRYYTNAFLAASFHEDGHYSEIDKDRPNYYFHFHLGADKYSKTGGHIFYGKTPSGMVPQ